MGSYRHEDQLGQKLKDFEGIEAQRKASPEEYLVVRLDGKAFHTFTKGLRKPFEERFTKLMKLVTIRLMEASGAKRGYTQSDEISLLFYKEDEKEELYFGGRYQKLCSVLASIATAHFNKELPAFLPEKADNMAFFDARAFSLPDYASVEEYFQWREEDAVKNSIQAAAQSLFSHKELHNLGCERLIEKMKREKNVIWKEYPSFFKKGTYFEKREVTKTYEPKDLESLPPKHNALSEQGSFTKIKKEIKEVDISFANIFKEHL